MQLERVILLTVTERVIAGERIIEQRCAHLSVGQHVVFSCDYSGIESSQEPALVYFGSVDVVVAGDELHFAVARCALDDAAGEADVDLRDEAWAGEQRPNLAQQRQFGPGLHGIVEGRAIDVVAPLSSPD